MPFTTYITFRTVSASILLMATLASFTACAKVAKPVPTMPPSPIDFAQALQYAQRSAVVYETDAVIRQKAPAGTAVSIMPETTTGIKAYVEIDDAKKRSEERRVGKECRL